MNIKYLNNHLIWNVTSVFLCATFFHDYAKWPVGQKTFFAERNYGKRGRVIMFILKIAIKAYSAPLVLRDD